jgi:hypothetical protein
MARRLKIGIPTKLLSNHYYLNEVSVEGKKTRKFNFTIGWYDLYATQIIRVGNCITLLSNPINITEDSFWKGSHFENLVKYVFWTFNRSFLLMLTEKMELLRLPVLQRCQEMLTANPTAYQEPISANADKELQWCYVKNIQLKKSEEFALMYTLDEENRTVLLSAIEKRIAEFPEPLNNPPFSEKPDPPPAADTDPQAAPKMIIFLEVLRPMNGSPEETLQFILQKVEKAGLDHNVTTQVTRLSNGKNPYGFNGAIGAVIDHFYQLNFFKKEYSLEEIFKAYLHYSGNRIGKLKTFISEFREDKSFLKNSAKLKALKINKLP